jgi:glycosyltransferase involved in cell wall biosynthesis
MQSLLRHVAPPDRLHLRLVPAVARGSGGITLVAAALLKLQLSAAPVDRRASDFDLVVSANNECDLGGRGVVYALSAARPRRPRHELRWYHASDAMRRAYYGVCARIARFSPERMAGNRTLVNSEWIGARVRALHGIETTTLHPPVPGDFPAVPWSAREDGFVTIGRISPEKRHGCMIDLVERVRAHGHDVRLHVVGTAGNDRYGRGLRRRMRAYAGWLTFHEGIDRTALLGLVTHQRYGLHAMVEEHFGIAVAELVRARLHRLRARDRRPREIVGDESRLLYGSLGDAESKILAILRDDRAQASLRTIWPDAPSSRAGALRRGGAGDRAGAPEGTDSHPAATCDAAPPGVRGCDPAPRSIARASSGVKHGANACGRARWRYGRARVAQATSTRTADCRRVSREASSAKSRPRPRRASSRALLLVAMIAVAVTRSLPMLLAARQAGAAHLPGVERAVYRT